MRRKESRLMLFFTSKWPSSSEGWQAVPHFDLWKVGRAPKGPSSPTLAPHSPTQTLWLRLVSQHSLSCAVPTALWGTACPYPTLTLPSHSSVPFPQALALSPERVAHGLAVGCHEELLGCHEEVLGRYEELKAAMRSCWAAMRS